MVLEANGALKPICHVNTRNRADRATLYHPPTIRESLKQDENKEGKPSDHNLVIVSPKSDLNFKLERHKIKIHIRPKPESKKALFVTEMARDKWSKLRSTEGADEKTEAFHENFMKTKDKYFSVKTVKMTNLYSKFVNELKETEPSKYFKIAKQIGGLEQRTNNQMVIECIQH